MPIVSCSCCGAAMDSERVIELANASPNPFMPRPKAVCTACNASCDLNEWTVKNGAFGNVALRFWNWWPLTEGFVARLSSVAGCSFTTVHEHI